MPILHKLIKNSKYLMGNSLGNNQFLFDYFSPIFPRYRIHRVTAKTDICIEGFPRSANSFLTSIFAKYNPQFKCADHLHAPMQIIKASMLEIPCIVVIRNPLDAIASTIAVDRSVSTTIVIKSYINFYESIWHIRNNFITAEFSKITNNPVDIIDAVNQRFNTNFVMGKMSSVVEQEVFTHLKKVKKKMRLSDTLVAVPTEAKEQIKQEIIKELEQNNFFKETEPIYKKFLSIAV